MKARWFIALGCGILLSSAARAAASDLDIFNAGLSVEPNVLILFDNSGSMNWNLPYDPNTTYGGSFNPATVYTRCRQFRSDCTCRRVQRSWFPHTHSCGFVDDNNDGNDDRAPSYVKIGNRLNYERTSSPSKLQIAKNTIDGLLADPGNDAVRFGLMLLDGNQILYCGQNASNYHNDRSILKAEIGTDHATLRNIVNNLTATSGTPLANRLIASARYFKNDGYFSAADPIQYSCQRNFVVIMTDGRPQGEGDTTSSDDAGQFSYIEDWLGNPADVDGDGRDPDLAHTQVPPGCTWNYWSFCEPQYSNDEEPCEYVNGGSDYLDDVAKKIYDEDLRSDLEGTQQVTTYTIGFTVANSLLDRTASNGGGEYFTANNADELANAFRETLRNILSETESFVAPVVPVSQSTRTQSGDRLYIALFRPRNGEERWPGNLKKYEVTAGGDLRDATGAPATDANGSILDGTKSFWDSVPSGSNVTQGGVGELLKNRGTPRNIYTYLGSADLTSSGNAFDLSNGAITATTLGVATAADRDDLIEYVRGTDAYDEDEDGDVTELRSWILGDIVHSVPIVVRYSSSQSVIFLGANDGMLHAFDDASGEELWAFIPPEFLGKLKQLPPGGSATHPFFVDGSPRLHTTESGQKILVFGLRRGGRGYYALDVTSPSAPSFLWQVNNSTAGASELGLTWSDPAFTKLKLGGSMVDIAVVGAGYDTYFDDSGSVGPNSSGMGRGIFFLNLLTGEVEAYLRVAGMDYAIPSAVTLLDVNGNGAFDRGYVGDMGGQMWSFDSDLTACRIFATPAGLKIHYPPDVVRDQGFISVFFGTGDRANPLETSTVDRIYLVKDDSSCTTASESDLVDVTDRVEQHGSEAEATLNDEVAAASGWFIRLDKNPGEKVLAPPTIFFNAFFTTFTPSTEACAAGGSARLYSLGYDAGGVPEDVVQGGDGGSGGGGGSGGSGSGGGGAAAVTLNDRQSDVGKSIPTEFTVTLQEGGSSGFVAASGSIVSVDPPDLPNNVFPIYWRQCTSLATCP